MKLFFHLLSGILLFLLDHGVFGFEKEEISVSVNEGDSVTLNTGVEIKQQKKIKWYCNGIRMAQISGDLSSICTDVKCNKNTERFRDRLKLDHQTGSLTIMNTTTEHTGHYQLHIISSSITEGIFNVFVHGVPAAVPAAERDKVKRKSVKEGESVTLDPGVINNPHDLKTWYFNEILITEMTGDQSKICTDVQCKERFRDRLKLDHQTGSLTITNTRNTDSGEYKLQINSTSSVISISYSIIKSFIVTVTASGLSSGVIVGIYSVVVVCGVVGVSVLLMAAAIWVIYYCCRSSTRERQNDIRIQHNNQENRVEDSSPNVYEIPLMEVNVEPYFRSPIQYQ